MILTLFFVKSRAYYKISLSFAKNIPIRRWFGFKLALRRKKDVLRRSFSADLVLFCDKTIETLRLFAENSLCFFGRTFSTDDFYDKLAQKRYHIEKPSRQKKR